MSGDMCRATTNTGFAVATCYLLDGHDGQHDDGTYHWPNVQPLQERGPEPCTDTIWVSDKTGTVACSLNQGHTTDHVENTTGRALHWPLVDWCLTPERGSIFQPPPCGNVSPNRLDRCALDAGQDEQHGGSNSSWPQARSNYRSDDLTGAKTDDLILDLFRRVEQLEQTSAGGAAVDDMFATMNRARQRLAQGLGEVEKRMTRLEQAQVYGPGPHDLSLLQASINTQFERLNENAQQWNQAMMDRLSAMWDALAVMAPVIESLAPPSLRVICGVPDLAGLYHCDLDPGHDGRHQNGTSSWPNQCGRGHPSRLDVTCVLVKGHTATGHRSDSRAGSGRVMWVDEPPQDIGVATHVEPGLDYPDTGTQTERASGSPAAVRCPERFREGQCLGYAGHDGECSAVPGSGNEQLCDPEEFEHTSYASLDYLNRRGGSDEPEPFDECGKDPSPGHPMPPCGLPEGHAGVCVSGPQPREDSPPLERF